MVNITLSIPRELHILIKKHNEIKWSEIARRALWEQALWEQAKKLQMMDELVKKSKFSKKDVEVLDKEIKEALLKRYSE
jgi:hypothetical protein